MSKQLLVLSREAEQYQRLIAEADLPGLRVQSTDSASIGAGLVGDCEIILGEPVLVSQVLEAATQLKWVQSCWAGVDALCRPGLRQDYLLTGVTGQFGQLISEYVTGYLFALERGFFDMRDNQMQQRWLPRLYRRPGEVTVGIVGLGSIGLRLAAVLSGLGFRVIGMNTSGEACENVEQVYSPDDSDEFYHAVDYLVITLPSTPRTRHFLNQETLRKLRPSSVVINVGRGSVVDANSLIQALQNNRLRAAVLDVFETEPLPVNSPLWQMPNVYITPHVAAVSFPKDIVDVFKDNYLRYLNKQSLQHIVNFDRGY